MKKNEKQSRKAKLVVGVSVDDLEITDERLRKPVMHQKLENGKIIASGLFQELDEVVIKNSTVTYFQPNNIAVLLSISKKNLEQAKIFFQQRFLKDLVLDYTKFNGDRKKFISDRSSEICDYIELIETSIVFSYTAIEAFANISIPEDYVYKRKKKKEIENLNKQLIELKLTLREKITLILPDIFNVKKPTQKKWWKTFTDLEDLRHKIIHQKAINSTNFYKCYFSKQIYNTCEVSQIIIKYFYSETAKQNKTHILWPWIDKVKTELPFTYLFNEIDPVIIGNIYEGKKSSRS